MSTLPAWVRAISAGGSQKPTALAKAAPLPSIGVRTGSSGPVDKSTGSGTGIASPLTEGDYSARTWHPERTVSSSEGLFVLVIKPVATMSFTDANNRPLVISYRAPG